MKKILLFVLAPLSWVGFAQESCELAMEIGTGIYTVSYAGIEAQPVQNCVNTASTPTAMVAWFKFLPIESKIYKINSDVPGQNLFDTRVHIYSGTCGELTCIGGDDDSGDGNTSSYVFYAIAGVEYYIAWDSQYNSNNFNFEIDELQPSEEGISWFPTNNVGGNTGGIYGLVDADGDYIDDLVGITSTEIFINKLDNFNGFNRTNIPFNAPLNYLPTWSMTGGDLNNDGINDFVIGNGQRAVIVHSYPNGTAEHFMQNTYVFSQRTNIVDLNNDGFNDVFVCHDVAPNIQYRNNGDGTYTYVQGGMGIHPNGGNYGSIFVDFDNDGDQDLFIAKCKAGNSSASKDEFFRNDGNYVFTDITAETDLGLLSQSWSSAWADFNNDGFMDVMIGVSTHTTGSHVLRLNNGDGTFTDATVGSGWDDNTTTSLEYLAHDFDNDGWVDILHSNGNIMKNNGDGTFTSTAASGAVPGGIGDINNDGFLDIFYGNNVRLAIPNQNNWLKVTLEGVESNRNGIGARVEIHGPWGIQIRDVRSGEGFKYMHSLNTHFGIGQNEGIDQLVIRWPSGTVDIINNPTINQVQHIVEGTTLSDSNWELTQIKVSPNPTSEILQVQGATFTKAKIYDSLGRVVAEQDFVNNTLNVASLAKGIYVLVATADSGLAKTVRFIKE